MNAFSVNESPAVGDVFPQDKYSKSSVAWGAVLGGACAAAVVSLMLLMLGSALGLSSISPWSSETVASFSVKAAIWLIVVQWLASAFGGYLSGRLRNRNAGLHGDELFFRDTAHGFLAWAVATLVTATVLASAATTAVGAGAMVLLPPDSPWLRLALMALAPHGPAMRPELMDPLGYYTDRLFRPAVVSAVPAAPAPTENIEAERILLKSAKDGSLEQSDRTYLTQPVAARTGLAEADASRRIDEVTAQVNEAKDKLKQDAEEARKTAMHVSIYLFLSLLIGAFIASCAAVIGGRHRDEF